MLSYDISLTSPYFLDLTELTQHFAEIGVMQIGILVSQTFAFDFRPDHERVHGASHALLTGLLLVSRVDLVCAGDAL